MNEEKIITYLPSVVLTRTIPFESCLDGIVYPLQGQSLVRTRPNCKFHQSLVGVIGLLTRLWIGEAVHADFRAGLETKELMNGLAPVPQHQVTCDMCRAQSRINKIGIQSWLSKR